MDELKNYLSREIQCHNWQIQSFSETSCGFYCLIFLLLCSKGYKYEDIILMLIK